MDPWWLWDVWVFFGIRLAICLSEKRVYLSQKWTGLIERVHGLSAQLLMFVLLGGGLMEKLCPLTVSRRAPNKQAAHAIADRWMTVRGAGSSMSLCSWTPNQALDQLGLVCWSLEAPGVFATEDSFISSDFFLPTLGVMHCQTPYHAQEACSPVPLSCKCSQDPIYQGDTAFFW